MPLNSEARIETDASREAVHDLRNLFGVISGAARLLERDDHGRHGAILAALQRAAIDGDHLATRLLAGTQSRLATIDLRQRLLALGPMMRSLADGTALTLDLPTTPLSVHFDAASFDAVMLELIANAHSARPHAGITIRAREAGARVWISIGDDGCGMAVKASLDALPCGANGIGLGRVRRAIAHAHGRIRVRSGAGRGTVVTLWMPTVLGLSRPRGVGCCLSRLSEEEKSNEKRHTIAA